MVFFWGGGKIGEGVVRYWPPTNSFLLFGFLTSVPIFVKIDQEMRPWECPQTDRHTDRQTGTHTDANRFYNLSHAICYSYSYGTDNNFLLAIRCIAVKCSYFSMLEVLNIIYLTISDSLIKHTRAVTVTITVIVRHKSWVTVTHPLPALEANRWIIPRLVKLALKPLLERCCCEKKNVRCY